MILTMRLLDSTSVSLWLLVLSLACFASNVDPHLTIETKSGTVHGFINATTPAVRQFLGISFAEPPLGSLCFAPPKVKGSRGPIDATRFGKSCFQRLSNEPSIYSVEPEYLINGEQSEDCLFINVWTPLQDPKKGKLPVFVYIPGGGFASGGANSRYKIPDEWIERTQGHIVVIMK
jgi:carboxylesterase type B